MTNAPQDVVSALHDRSVAHIIETTAGKATALPAVVDIVEAELKGYFSVRECAGREGLHEWELNYICGRIFLALSAVD
jgi:hypothetical protein